MQGLSGNWMYYKMITDIQVEGVAILRDESHRKRQRSKSTLLAKASLFVRFLVNWYLCFFSKLSLRNYSSEKGFDVRSKLATLDWNFMQLEEHVDKTRTVIGQRSYYCKTRKMVVINIEKFK